MADMKDYGDAESATLVPASLRVFRHFMVDARTMVLAPMNYYPESWSPLSENEKPYSLPDVDPVTGVVHPYEGRCVHYEHPGVFASTSTGTRSGTLAAMSGGPHKTPSVDCSCGFYAHYKPTTDFYPGSSWGAAIADPFGGPIRKGLVIVRAVVEVSGTVVMGRLGVRAQKMRVIAITPDWDKYASPPRYLSGFTSDACDCPSCRAAFPGAEDVEREKGKAMAAVEEVAARYGIAEVFDDAGDMYTVYPAEDIEALGVDTVYPAEDIEALGVDTSPPPSLMPKPQTASQLMAGLKSGGFTVDFKVFDEAVQSTSDSFQKLYEAMFPPMPETVQERALRLKKDRPAPPGSGIDRRRGRLR